MVVEPSTINLTDESIDISVGMIGEYRVMARASVATDTITHGRPVGRGRVEG